MYIFKHSADIIAYLQRQRKAGSKSGFVPTMGALHQGHLSLIDKAKSETDMVVCSIFVNPTQFNDPRDYAMYPKSVENDVLMLERAECNVLFLPDVLEIYPPGVNTKKHYALGELESVLEGKYRPGHFQGVCRVMDRLMDIIKPDVLFLGQKDFQQCMIIKKLFSLLEIKSGIEICPIEREVDGLAMSSRNRRLDPTEREKATGICKTLSFVKENIHSGNLDKLIEEARQILLSHDFKIDYIEAATVDRLQSISSWDGKTEIVVLVAAYMGEVRLIDNIVITA
ncbi:MAG: pantoate--beta-alanine ligase [Chitinophagaceae bacterium]|nr:pantoate--beta-alanine ligase [Chitinophagaceae bacterium]